MENRRTFIQSAAAVGAALTLPTRRVLGANDRVRVGIIGAGARGKEVLKEFIKQGCEVVAVADVFKSRQEEVRALGPSVKTFDDHRKMLELKDVDAVLVASPLHCHARHFIDALSAGKDMYSEKTMTWSMAEADACRKAAEKHGNRIVTIGLQNQSAPSMASARKWVKDGLVGKVTSVESWMSRNTPAGKGQWVRPIPQDCTPANVRWDLFLNGRQKRAFDPQKFVNWRLYWEFSGGNCAENMVHQVAWLQTVLDLPAPTAAYMSGGVFAEKDGREVPDTISVVLDYPETVINWQSTFSNKAYGLGDRILGSHGTIERLQGSTDMVSGKPSGQTLRYFPEKTNRADGTPLSGSGAEENAPHVANFLDSLRSRKPTTATVDVGYKSALAVHMANISYRLKRRVTEAEARKLAGHGLHGEGGRPDLA